MSGQGGNAGPGVFRVGDVANVELGPDIRRGVAELDGKGEVVGGIVVSLVIVIFLVHVRSAPVPILALPVAVVGAFIPKYHLGVTSNIMSLGGLALAIGVLVDASIVMVENAYRHVSEPDLASSVLPSRPAW